MSFSSTPGRDTKIFFTLDQIIILIINVYKNFHQKQIGIFAGAL